MRIALRELRRRPGRVLPVGGAMTLLVALLIVLAGFLDGLELSQTGAYRAHGGRVLVFSKGADLQLQRSRVDAATADAVAAIEGAAAVTPLESFATTAGPGTADADTTARTTMADVVDVVVFGYGAATATLPAPPEDGAVVDAALLDGVDVSVGDTLLVGPQAAQVRVAAIVDDLSQGAPTIWVPSSRWRELAAQAAPSAVTTSGTAQALVVTPARGVAVADLTRRIDQALAQVDAATSEEVIQALPVVQQQSSTFRGIIGVTFIVTLLVVALFFVLLTLERTNLYAVLKAIGGRSVDLVVGVTTQAVVVTIGALVIGITVSIIFVWLLPADLPLRLLPSRLVQVAAGTLVTAAVGSLFTLRRILRIDPAEAIG